MKRLIWALAAGCIVLALVWGVMRLWPCQRGLADGGGPTADSGRPSLTMEQQHELERIATLGYVAGVEPVPAQTGVLTYVPEAAFNGLTLYTGGEGLEAFLIDMHGDIIHKWSYQGSKGWPRARILPDGGLLAITADPPSLLRLDAESRLLWRFDDHAHHDLAVLGDGSICVLVRGMARRDYLNGGEPVIDDNVVLLDSEGRELAFISLLRAFERSEFGASWIEDHPFPQEEDIFHTNSIQALDRSGRLQLLLSIRSIDTVAVLDVASGEIVWAMAGRWHKQHEAQFVGKNLLLFDNLGLAHEGDGPNQSRVIEIDMESGELVWSFSEPGFFTQRAGAQQRLPNDNTLITESEAGRVIEVTPDGRIVWEYVNPMAVEGRPEIMLGILRAERITTRLAPAWGR
ncbi:MAG: aryl-sulfate sulfotransferase [Candidatus Eisenbacteria bacterium]|nr:aryl-sulfate sulfotransferase [Candidatus Eisenbacteria bacterium]